MSSPAVPSALWRGEFYLDHFSEHVDGLRFDGLLGASASVFEGDESEAARSLLYHVHHDDRLSWSNIAFDVVCVFLSDSWLMGKVMALRLDNTHISNWTKA